MSVFCSSEAGSWLSSDELFRILNTLIDELGAHHKECPNNEDDCYTITLKASHDGEDPSEGEIVIAHIADCDWTTKKFL